MAAVGKCLIEGTQIASSTTTYYTSSLVNTRVDKCTVINNSGSAKTFSIYKVASGGSAGASNQLIATRSIQDGETYTCPEVVGHWLNNGDFLAAIASSATSLSLSASGITVS